MQNFKTVGEKILKQTPYGCRVEGTKVVMTLGKAVVTMDYDTAIKLSAFLKYSGKLAKRAAGDISKHMIVVADLTDANADEMHAVISSDRKSVFYRP